MQNDDAPGLVANPFNNVEQYSVSHPASAARRAMIQQAANFDIVASVFPCDLAAGGKQCKPINLREKTILPAICVSFRNQFRETGMLCLDFDFRRFGVSHLVSFRFTHAAGLGSASLSGALARQTCILPQI